MNRSNSARLAGWLDLTARGWALIPIRPGSKAPSVRRWEQHASTDPDRIAAFFTRHPDHNAGIACGPSGLLVIDCDQPKPDQPPDEHPRDGWAVLARLAHPHGGLPATWTVTTPSGGRHLYFRAPDPATASRSALGNTARALGPLLDTRGRGGQVLAPGSRLPHGGYQLLDDTSPAALPTWLVQALTVRPATAVSGPAERSCGVVGDQGAYVAAAVRAELARVSQAGRGGHNAAVFTAARALGQLIGAGVLDPATAERDLTAAAHPIITGPCDCTARGITASIRSGLAYGVNRPRQLPTTRPAPLRRTA